MAYVDKDHPEYKKLLKEAQAAGAKMGAASHKKRKGSEEYQGWIKRMKTHGKRRIKTMPRDAKGRLMKA